MNEFDIKFDAVDIINACDKENVKFHALTHGVKLNIVEAPSPKFIVNGNEILCRTFRINRSITQEALDAFKYHNISVKETIFFEYIARSILDFSLGMKKSEVSVYILNGYVSKFEMPTELDNTIYDTIYGIILRIAIV